MYRILRPGDEAALEAYLRPRLASSMFLLSNMRQSGLADGDGRSHGAYAAAFDGERIVGVVGHFWNGNLLTQSPLEHLDALWRLAVQTSGREIWGVVAPADQAFAVHAGLDVGPQQTRLADRENLYALTLDELTIPQALAQGDVRVRPMEADDVEMLTDWRTAYSVETMAQEPTPSLQRQNREAMERYLRSGECWVAEVNGRPVAMSTINARLPEAVQVGGVFTPPALRRRGYARCTVAQSLLDARAAGANTAILFTGKKNAGAHGAYTALGFRVIDEYAIILLRSPVRLERRGA